MRVQRRVRRGLAAAVVGVAALAVMPTSAFALTSAPDSTTWGTTGKVYALAKNGNTLFIGGRFDHVNGVAVSNFAALSTDTGAVSVNPTFSPNVNKAVEAIVVGTDKVFIGGSFKKVNNQDRLRLAAINFDGTLNAWAPMANAVVRSMAMAPDGNTLFVGGLFDHINNVSRQS